MEKRLKLLSDILAIDSTNGNEAAVATCIQSYLNEADIESTQVMFDPNRANLVASIGEGEKVLGISGHMDVVSSGDEKLWTSPPFTPTIRDNKLYARGASDMKSGLAALIMAMIELKKEQVPLKGKIKLLATLGEEIGLLGAKQLTDEGYANDLDALIIGEPTDHQIVFAHKGVYTYKVTSYGKNAHSSMPELGINAIDNLIIFYNEIKKAFAQISKTNEPLGEFIVCNSIIKGGEQVNSVPDVAELTANIRTIPEVPNELVTTTLQNVVHDLNQNIKGMKLKLEIKQSTHPVFSDPNSKLVQVAKKQAELVFNQEVPLIGMPGGADSAEFIRANKDMQIIIFGPGNDTLHQIDEYVGIDNYLEMVDIYKSIIVEFLS